MVFNNIKAVFILLKTKEYKKNIRTAKQNHENLSIPLKKCKHSLSAYFVIGTEYATHQS